MNIFLVASLSLWVIVASQAQTATSVKVSASAAMKEYNKVASKSFAINYNSNNSASAKPGIIEVDPDHLSVTLSKLNNGYSAVKLVVAHEFVHCLQYEQFGEESMLKKADDQTRRLIEAQADILGGYYYGYSFLSPRKGPTKDEIQDAIELMYDLAATNPAYRSNYPTSEMRRKLIRLGMSRATRQQMIEERDPQWRQAISTLTTKLDVSTPSESVFDWGLRMAAMIINFDDDTGKDLLELSEENLINWNPNGTVTYALKYKNAGSTPIRLKAAVESSAKKVDDPLNTEFYTLWDATYHEVTIDPGQTITLRGKMIWSNQLSMAIDEEGMGVLTFPPHLHSMYSVRPSGKSIRDMMFQETTDQPVQYQISEDERADLIMRKADFVEKLKNDLHTLESSYVVQLRRGAGTLDTDLETITYKSAFQVAGAAYTDVEIDYPNDDDCGTCSIVAYMYLGPNSSTADRMFNLCSEAVTAYAGKEPEVGKPANERSERLIWKAEGKKRVSVVKLYFTSSQSYSVRITM